MTIKLFRSPSCVRDLGRPRRDTQTRRGVSAPACVDQTGNYVFAVEPQGVGKSFSKTAGYWSVANGFDTMFTLWNMTTSAQDFLVTFYYGDGSGKYDLPVHLDAQESTMIDMAMFIEMRQPDADGNLFPAGVREGSAVFASAKGMREPMTLSVSQGTFNVQAATCGIPICISCCGYSGFTVSPDPLDVLVGTTGQANSQATSCDGTTLNPSSWSGSDTSIATVSSSGVVTAVSYGSATITANHPTLQTYTGLICSPCPTGAPQAQTTARSRQTKWAVRRSDNTTIYALCGSTERDLFYQGQDDYGWIPLNEFWKLNETVTFVSSPSCTPLIDGSKFAVGFEDAIAVCPKSCSFESNQFFSVAKDQFSPLRQVPGKNCDGCPAHSGWHVTASGTSVQLTDNP